MQVTPPLFIRNVLNGYAELIELEPGKYFAHAIRQQFLAGEMAKKALVQFRRQLKPLMPKGTWHENITAAEYREVMAEHNQESENSIIVDKADFVDAMGIYEQEAKRHDYVMRRLAES